MKKWTPLLCRWGLAIVFLAAAIPKIRDPHDFALAVFRYQMLPYELVNLVALFLPWLEALTAIALLAAPRWRDAASAILLGMLAVFTVAIVAALVRGIDIACGCFSVNPDAEKAGWLNVARNIALMVMALVAWLDAARKQAKFVPSTRAFG